MPEGKKNPTFLEEITLDEEQLSWEKDQDVFARSSLFLGRYDEKDLMGLMEDAGVLALIRKKGYQNLIISISREDYTSRLYLNYDRLDKETRLIELILREGLFRPNKTFIERFDFNEGLSMILVEWLALQHPLGKFTPERPKLPGQAYPGLGGLRNLQQLLYIFGEKGHKDAIVDVPQHYHAAVIYSRLYSSIYSRMYSFFSPVDAGLFKALTRDLNDRPLAEISLAVSFGCLLNLTTGEHETWRPSDQIYPITKRVQAYVESPEYRQIAEKTAAKVKYAVDWDMFRQIVEHGVPDDI